MNLSLSPEREAIRAEAMAWLDSWLGTNLRADTDQRLDLDFRRSYQADAYDAGWLVPSWPLGEGGREVDEETELWIKLDFARRGAPKLPNVQGPGVIAQALRGYGTEAQREQIHAVARGDVWWCLGMSEPGAGSDLASLRTRAVETEHGWRIDGQKVWTSHARFSICCLVFARTGEIADGHRGISAFAVPMDTPGVTIRPIEKIGAEDEEFCEVFYDSVEVSAEAMVGPLNGGWRVAMDSLNHERDMSWIMNLVEIEESLRLMREELAERPEPSLMLELARLRADADSIWLTGLRGLGERVAGRPDILTVPLKLFSTEVAQQAFLLAGRICGPEAALLTDAGRGGDVAYGELEALGATIYGGTSEIQRNIFAERVLGLPR
jgi:alkylation response protein AidB-like acyl-CoA dehydrogenase